MIKVFHHIDEELPYTSWENICYLSYKILLRPVQLYPYQILTKCPTIHVVVLTGLGLTSGSVRLQQRSGLQTTCTHCSCLGSKQIPALSMFVSQVCLQTTYHKRIKVFLRDMLMLSNKGFWWCPEAFSCLINHSIYSQ